jgi:hypothetical protein
VHGEDRVLTMPRRQVTDEAALLAVVKRWRRFEWDRFLIGLCAAFHLGVAVPLALAPVDQIVNAGTAPVFDIASRYVWAVAYLVAGSAAVLLLRWRTPFVQCLTWFTVLPLGGLWWTAFVLAVLSGRGSAIGVVVWLTLYGLFSVVAVRVALGKR